MTKPALPVPVRAIEKSPAQGGLFHLRGTSDARFTASYCPVDRIRLVGQTMHQVDERTPVSDLESDEDLSRRAG